MRNHHFRYDGENWTRTNTPVNAYSNYHTANMALYKEKPVMVGSVERYGEGLGQLNENWRSLASYFEVFDPETEEWSTLNRNQFFNEWTSAYRAGASVTKDDSFLIFGGSVSFYTGKVQK